MTPENLKKATERVYPRSRVEVIPQYGMAEAQVMSNNADMIEGRI